MVATPRDCFGKVIVWLLEDKSLVAHVWAIQKGHESEFSNSSYLPQNYLDHCGLREERTEFYKPDDFAQLVGEVAKTGSRFLLNLTFDSFNHAVGVKVTEDGVLFFEPSKNACYNVRSLQGLGIALTLFCQAQGQKGENLKEGQAIFYEKAS